ncbi:fatty acid cis/trans isomerase [Vibrio sp. S4M6]|uniref:fatty acid cis/trans isomerase n=1 Tax=Vibrio sinus TaxID=2946865 RepID=UPI00202A69F3|nr:fatty acid cis/trans isomerase [Vibrio sinus]MCL9779902.1 fatty acid cis/trans isomerase [Vibrio sinus]
MKVRTLYLLIGLSILSGCATYASYNYDELFGKQEVRDRTAKLGSVEADFYLDEVKPIIDNRCVVCHACYDAPCQLKLSSVAGTDRGGTKQLVYDGTRLTAATPTRLFEDAQITQQWREMDFHPILNERTQTPEANWQAGLMARLLELKEKHPQPQVNQLKGFDFSIDRDQVCPSIEEFSYYEKRFPTWGMPFGMPNLEKKELDTLKIWLKSNAMMNEPIPLTKLEQQNVDKYEAFLNRDDLKTQLMARYIFEHLFLAHLYFSEISAERPRFFTLVRSKTPPGQPVVRIPTRRPYGDPGVKRVYYRIIPDQETIVDKTHMPFALNKEKLAKWNKWFIDADYTVSALPSYQPDVAANPMTAFTELPITGRYHFMLDNAQNTIMAFIKGPVCRGQIALNVIRDRFFVFFFDPDKANVPAINDFFRSQADNLKLPGELQSNALPITSWVKFSRQQARFLEAKSEFLNTWFKNGAHLTTDIIWDGDGVNPNAALTVFRHFDSASVVRGMVGGPTETAWILDYELIERIHYLLVADFDVYGNFGHQLITRMFMDFLRMEGEMNFLHFLPADSRHKQMSLWYKNQSIQLSTFLQRNVEPFSQPTQIQYKTDDPKLELYQMLREKLAPVLSNRYDIVDTGFTAQNEQTLNEINQLTGRGLIYVPQIVMMMIESNSGEKQAFTLLHNNAHLNVSSLFDEAKNRDPDHDSLTLVRGVMGSYPAIFLSLKENEIPELVKMFKNIKSNDDCIKLLDRFAIRRTSPEFWSFSDQIHQWYRQDQPIEFGLLDYNRFENR